MHAEFHWKPFVDSTALYLGQSVVATLTTLSNGVRIRFFNGRHAFRPDEASAIRAAESWATRWEQEIRQGVGNVPRLATSWQGHGMPGLHGASTETDDGLAR